MHKYEITFLTRSEDNSAGLADVIAQLGGRILTQEAPVRRKLTYPIKRETAAVYFTYLFELEPTKVGELTEKLARNEHILRHLVIAGGIRKPVVDLTPRKLKEEDLEVPASVIAGEAALAQEKAAIAQEPAPAVTEPAAAPTLDEVGAPTASVGEVPQEELAAHELTADERQQKLDEKLKKILGE